MPCKCFENIKSSANLPFEERLETYKCRCAARFSAEENKRFFILKDADIEEVEKYQIDGGIINDTKSNRCDYLFVFQNKRFFFVELKGTDIKHALVQIEATMQLFYAKGIISNKGTRCCIVFSSYPKDNGTYRKGVITLRKNWKNKVANIEVYQKSKRMEYSAQWDRILE